MSTTGPGRHASRAELGELAADFAPTGVPYAVVVPPGYDEGANYPLCLLLHGGGGSRQNLVDLKPLLDQLWSDDTLPPMVFASASTGPMSFYLDHPDGKYFWERFVSVDLLEHLRRSYRVARGHASTALMGISMGGYGALKIAFRNPERFGAVVAVQPMLEPGLEASAAGPRNRFYYQVNGAPDELLGTNRNAKLWESNNPANRASANAPEIRNSGLAIYLEVGDHDLLNAHDGTEFLHRVLWDLDISHEYHLVRGGDHSGPTLVPRLREAFAWLGGVIKSSQAPEEDTTVAEGAIKEWFERGLQGEAPPVDTRTAAFVRALRAQLEPARQQAASLDPSVNRRFGVLPPTRKAYSG